MNPGFAFFAVLFLVGVGYAVIPPMRAHRDPVLEPDRSREGIRRALSASHTFTGRAWTAADISSTPVATSSGPRYGPGVGDRGRSGALLLGHLNDRNLSDVSTVPPVRLVGGRQTGRGKSFGLTPADGATRATPTAMAARLPAENDTASTTTRSRRGI